MAVIPSRARLVGERQTGNPIGELGVVEITQGDVTVRVGLFDQAVAKETVGDAGGMPHQVLNGHRLFWLDEVEHSLAVIALSLNPNLHILELRDVFCDRFLEAEATFLDQHHGRDRGDWLRHRVDAEDRVVRHRGPVGRIALAPGAPIGDLAVPDDGDRGAWDETLGDIGRNVVVDVRKGTRQQAEAHAAILSDRVIGPQQDRRHQSSAETFRHRPRTPTEAVGVFAPLSDRISPPHVRAMSFVRITQFFRSFPIEAAVLEAASPQSRLNLI